MCVWCECVTVYVSVCVYVSGWVNVFVCEYVCGRADQQGIIYTFLKMIRCGILSHYVAATA